MVEFLLQRPAFLALLDAIHVDRIVGIAPERLFPADDQQRRPIVEEGIAQLQAQHLLVLPQGETPILDRDLLAVVTAVATPDVAFMIVRNVAGVGPQLFLEYISGPLVVEQTFPQEGIHRLALLGEVPALKARIAEILPMPASSAEQDASSDSLTIAQDAFFAADRLIEEGRRDEAYALLARETGESATLAALVSALNQPTLRGNVALLRCRQGEIVDARNAAMVRQEDHAWFIAQRTPGEDVLTINATTADQAQQRLWQWYDEMAGAG